MDFTAIEAAVGSSSAVFIAIFLISPAQKPLFLLSRQHRPWDLYHGGSCYSTTHAVLNCQSVLLQTRI